MTICLSIHQSLEANFNTLGLNLLLLDQIGEMVREFSGMLQGTELFLHQQAMLKQLFSLLRLQLLGVNNANIR